MTAIKLDKFGGMLPAWDDQLLPDGQASSALNAYLFSGALIGWRKPKRLRNLLNSSAAYVYRVPKITGDNQSADTSITAADSIWLEFLDRDTDVVRSPVVNDQYGRYYFASPSRQPEYNTYDRIVAGSPPWLLGVPAPGCEPGVTVAGGGETSQLGFTVDNSDNVDTPGANTISLIPIMPTGELLLNDVSILPATTNVTANFRAVVYTSFADAPFELLNQGSIVVGSTADTELALPFDNPSPLIAGLKYWIGFMTDSDIAINRSDDTGFTTQLFSNTFSNEAPAVLGLGAARSNWRIWGNMTGDSVFEARAYVYTWVTAYAEEGPPSPAALVQGWSNAVWTLSLFTPPTADMGTDRNITLKRIYRTVTSLAGPTTYFFVAELPVTQETYVDSAGNDVISVNEQLASQTWFPPPEDLQGFAALPNGFFVGFKANEIWFSEPFRPHAWPPGYVLTTEFPIVGVGVTGTAAVACTKANPYVASGVNPASMSLTKVLIPEPCVSKGSITSYESGILYYSPNGLILVSQSGQAGNITEFWITRERWHELTPTSNICGIKLSSSYFAFGVVNGTDASQAQKGFTIELSNNDQRSFSIWPQPGGHRIGFGKLSAPGGLDVKNVIVDPWTGIGLLIQGDGVYYYDFTDQAPEIEPYIWRSKIYQQNAKKNFAAMRAFFSVPESTPEQNGTRNTATVQTLADDQYGIIRVYADGNLITTREIRTSGELLRIASDRKAEKWQFEIEGRVNVSNLQLATSVKELAGV